MMFQTWPDVIWECTLEVWTSYSYYEVILGAGFQNPYNNNPYCVYLLNKFIWKSWTKLESCLCRVSIQSFQRHRVSVRHLRLDMNDKHIVACAALQRCRQVCQHHFAMIPNTTTTITITTNTTSNNNNNITWDINVVSVSLLVSKSLSLNWLCLNWLCLSPEPTSAKHYNQLILVSEAFVVKLGLDITDRCHFDII